MRFHMDREAHFMQRLLDSDFDADNKDFIASLIVDVAHGHTVSVSELPHTFPTAAGKSAIPLLQNAREDGRQQR